MVKTISLARYSNGKEAVLKTAEGQTFVGSSPTLVVKLNASASAEQGE